MSLVPPSAIHTTAHRLKLYFPERGMYIEQESR